MTRIFSRPRKHLLPMLLALFLISLFGCFKKKNSNPTNLQEWLDVQWLGRFEVLFTPTNFTDKEYYYGKRKSVVAEKDDQDVQLIVHWVKDEENMGISTEMIDSSAARSRENVRRGRDFVKQLNTAGLQNLSVSKNPDYAELFLFSEPTPEERKRVLEIILEFMQKTPESDRVPCDVVFMEPKMYGTEFKDVVPAGHWARIDSWHRSNQIMQVSIPSDHPESAKTLSTQWKFNTLSDRMLEYVRKTHPLAQAWAEKHISKPVVVSDNMVEFGVHEDNGLLVEIDFPYTFGTGEGQENSGKISGSYNIDAATFTGIKAIQHED